MLAPAALWFGLTLPVIVLLWLLKRRRQEQEVSSTYLWRQVLRDVRANAPWQRLRAHLLLILQLAAAALLALALARPHLTGAAAGRAHLILLLDGSGSMQAAAGAPGGPTRFDRARAEAAAQVQALRSRDRATVVLVARMPRLLVARVAPEEALAALAAAQPTHEVADWGQALSLGAASGREQPGARMMVLTDAAVDPAALAGLGLPARAVTVGEPAGNLALRLALRPGGSGGPASALGRVTNYGRQQAEARVEFLADGNLVDERRLDVPPGGAAEVVWRDLPAGARVFSARLDVRDALAADNQAHAVLPRSGRTQALLVSRANLFLEQALRLREDLELVQATPQNYAPGPYQLYIFDGWLPPELPAGALLLVSPPDGNPIMPLQASVPVTSIRPGPRAGSLLAYVPLDGVHVARARPLTVPPWANVLLEAPEGPLLAAGHQEGRPVAVLGFDIHESDFPLRVGFPVLVQNLLTWLVPVEPAAARATAGEPVPLALDPLATGAAVTTPSGRKVPVAPPFPAAPWTDTGAPGVYTLVQTLPAGDRTSHFVVEFPAAESEPAATLAVAAAPVSGDAAARPPLREVWPWAAALALTILGVEWWVYIRGS